MKKRSRTTLLSLRAPDELAAAILRYQELLRMENVSESLVYFLKIGVKEFERQKSKKVIKRGEFEREQDQILNLQIEDENEFLQKQIEQLTMTITTMRELLDVIIAQNSCLYEAGPYATMLQTEKDTDKIDRFRDTLYKIKLQEVKQKGKYL